MSLLNHPDFETCIKPWCAAVARGEEPPKVEQWFLGVGWGVTTFPAWEPGTRYCLVSRKIKIGQREVNAPVENGEFNLALICRNRGGILDNLSVDFITEADAIAARDAIVAMLRGDE